MKFRDFCSDREKDSDLNEARKLKSPKDIVKAYKDGRNDALNKAVNIGLQAEELEEMIMGAYEDDESVQDVLDDLLKRVATNAFQSPDLDPDGIWDDLIDRG